MLRNNLPTAKPVTSVPTVAKDVIMNLSRDIVGSGGTVIEDAHLIYVHNRYPERLDLAYETTIRTAKGDELWRLTFDAGTGQLLERKDLIAKDCFRHNPLTESESMYSRSVSPLPTQTPQVNATGNVTGLIHPKTPYDAPVSVGMPFLELTVNGKKTTTDISGNFTITNITNPLVITSTNLKSKYVTIFRSDAASATILDTFSISPVKLQLTDDVSHIAERDVFISIEEIRKHVRSLDPTLTTLDEPMVATVNYPSDCNAFYDQSQVGFTFFDESSTCNNTASVADVVYHEFGHRINHARYGQASGNGRSMTDGSLNEGFADVVSAFKRDDARIGIGFYKNAPTKVLRNIDSVDKVWPKNISGDTHANGLIIAGAFWDLRKTLGLPQTEKLFHMMGYQQPDGTGEVTALALNEAFINTLLATLITDDVDNDLTNGTPNMGKILAAFEKHGITLTGLIDLSPQQIPDQDQLATEYPVTVTASYASAIGALDTTSVRVYYRHIDSTAYNFITLTQTDGGTYSGSIPKMSAGSIVEYYARAATTLSTTSVKEFPLPSSPMTFLVGYQKHILDDCESDENWIHDDADNASAGLWVLAEPKGTFYQGAANEFVQQDTDHTPTGVNCFVTGNSNSASPSLDDVDNGTTSLISPAYNLSAMRDPVIRWWYYYSNATGQNPGVPKWVVKISDDDGTTYKNAHSTALSTDGWVLYTIRVTDYVPLSSTIRLKFIASDNVGALVEAGIDDIEILDVPAPESVYPADNVTSTLTLFPNPVTGSRVTIHLNELQLRSLSLRDILGKVVLSRENHRTHGNTLELAIPEALSNGTYMLEYTTSEGQTRHEKLVIAR